MNWIILIERTLLKIDTTLTSDTIHFSKYRPVISEDDSLTDDFMAKDISLGSSTEALRTVTRKPRCRHATILRNPSIRDREILCKFNSLTIITTIFIVVMVFLFV